MSPRAVRAASRSTVRTSESMRVISYSRVATACSRACWSKAGVEASGPDDSSLASFFSMPSLHRVAHAVEAFVELLAAGRDVGRPLIGVALGLFRAEGAERGWQGR